MSTCIHVSARSEGWKHTGEGESAENFDYPVLYNQITMYVCYTSKHVRQCSVHVFYRCACVHTCMATSIHCHVHVHVPGDSKILLSPWCYWTVYWVIKISLYFLPHLSSLPALGDFHFTSRAVCYGCLQPRELWFIV